MPRLKSVKQLNIKPDITIVELLDEMAECGVLGAGRAGRAAQLLAEIFQDENYTVFLALAGPAIPGGLRKIIAKLVKLKFLDALVVTGANITHDLIEALGFKHWQGSFYADDRKLEGDRLGRVGDIYVEQKAFETLEKKIYSFLDEASQTYKSEALGVYELLWLLGGKIEDEDSVLRVAAEQRIPVFSPGIYDSMIGLHLWGYSKLKGFKLDLNRDMSRLADMVFESKKIGAVILGGGLPKHYVLGASILKGGVDAAVQITLDRPESGSLSGANLEEAISWGKAKPESRLASIIGDYTFVFPVLASYVLAKIQGEKYGS
jgi:deoxyhypusine synthase